ncbi:MAG: DapH/DapD/GlmU-related protein [Candidatus Obscuribacterales bacterium]
MTARLTNSNNVSPSARIGNNVKIASDAIIMDGVEIGDDSIVEPGAVLYENVKLGKNCFVGAQCILGERLANFRDSDYVNPPLTIGDNSTVRSGTIIYADCSMGVNFQTGHRAIIRESSRFGNNCSFGTLSQSDGHIQIADNCRFHNNVFIATFTTCEENVHFYPMSCTVDSLHPPCQKGREGPYLERNVTVGAKVLILPRVRVGQGAVLAGASVVTHEVPPNMVVAGAPARVIKNKQEVRCHLEDRPAYDVAMESLECQDAHK